VSYVSNI